MADTYEIAATYFESWKNRDFVTFRANLADDCTFNGPMGQETSGDACAASISKLREMLDDIVVRQIVADGDNAITWFEITPKGGTPMAVANWQQVENGKIKRIQVTFDPRPMMK